MERTLRAEGRSRLPSDGVRSRQPIASRSRSPRRAAEELARDARTARTRPSSSTPPSCSPTRGRCSGSRSTRSCCRSSSSPSSRASGTTRSSATSPARRCGCSTTCGSARAGSTRPCRSATTAARCASSSTTPTRASLPAGFRLGDNDTRILAGRQEPRRRGLRRHRRQQGPADAGQGVGGRARGRGVPRRAGASTPAGPAWPSSTSPSRRWTALYERGRVEHAGAAELPCHTGLVLLSPRGSGLGRVGADKQIRLVRGDRDAFGLHGRSRRAADRPRPAARPRRRASSASAAGPAPASRRWPCAPASRRSWSAASTARSSSSARCTPSAARSSATCPGTEQRR